MNPFLTVVTRCYKRPKMLAKNKRSLATQSDPDYEQIFIVDDVGRGVAWANKQFMTVRDQINGRYVLILDDDDFISHKHAIRILKNHANKYNSDIIFFKAYHGINGILPDKVSWKGKPEIGHIGSCDFIMKADLWKEYIVHFGLYGGCGDYHMLTEIWKRKDLKVFWLDRQLASVNRVSLGKPE